MKRQGHLPEVVVAVTATGIAAGGDFHNLFQDKEIASRVPQWLVHGLHLPWPEKLFAFGPKHWPFLAANDKLPLPTSPQSLFAIFMFVLLGGSLFYFARRKLD